MNAKMNGNDNVFKSPAEGIKLEIEGLSDKVQHASVCRSFDVDSFTPPGFPSPGQGHHESRVFLTCAISSLTKTA